MVPRLQKVEKRGTETGIRTGLRKLDEAMVFPFPENVVDRPRLPGAVVRALLTPFGGPPFFRAVG